MKQCKLAVRLAPLMRAAIGAALTVSAIAAHADFTGKVIRILDGDTLEVLVDPKPVRVRLRKRSHSGPSPDRSSPTSRSAVKWLSVSKERTATGGTWALSWPAVRTSTEQWLPPAWHGPTGSTSRTRPC